MRPRVNDGATVVLAPVPTRPCGACTSDDSSECDTCDGDRTIPNLCVEDIVLVKVRGTVYLHLIKAIQGRRYQIGNNRGHINGWVGRDAVYGVAVSVDGRPTR
jgi:hypothetical protein